MDADNCLFDLRVSAYISGCNFKWSDRVLSFDALRTPSCPQLVYGLLDTRVRLLVS